MPAVFRLSHLVSSRQKRSSTAFCGITCSMRCVIGVEHDEVRKAQKPPKLLINDVPEFTFARTFLEHVLNHRSAEKTFGQPT